MSSNEEHSQTGQNEQGKDDDGDSYPIDDIADAEETKDGEGP